MSEDVFTDMLEDDPEPPSMTTTGLSGLENCPLHRNTPFGIKNVSSSQFSIARHYGGIKYNGDSYTYLPPTDELIRDDVLKWQQKNSKKKKKTPPGYDHPHQSQVSNHLPKRTN